MFCLCYLFAMFIRCYLVICWYDIYNYLSLSLIFPSFSQYASFGVPNTIIRLPLIYLWYTIFGPLSAEDPRYRYHGAGTRWKVCHRWSWCETYLGTNTMDSTVSVDADFHTGFSPWFGFSRPSSPLPTYQELLWRYELELSCKIKSWSSSLLRSRCVKRWCSMISNWDIFESRFSYL